MAHSASSVRTMDHRLRVVSVVGSKPQILRAAALWPALHDLHDPFLIDSGEFGGRSRPFYGEFGAPSPDRKLQVTRAGFAAGLERQLGPLLQQLRAAVVLAIGDSATTLAAARAAQAARIPVARVEAGSAESVGPDGRAERLRELDRISCLWFCETPFEAERLRVAGILAEVHVVGDLTVDATLRFRMLARRRSTALAGWGLTPGGYLLVALNVAKLEPPGQPERPARLVELLAGIDRPMLFPVDSRARSMLRAAGVLERLEAIEGLRLTPPLGYLDLLRLADAASHVLTDLWLLTKQAYALGTPCLTLADHTKWVETVAAGWNTVVDIEPHAVAAALAAPRPGERPELYGGGHTAERISRTLARWTPGSR